MRCYGIYYRLPLKKVLVYQQSRGRYINKFYMLYIISWLKTDGKKSTKYQNEDFFFFFYKLSNN